MNAYDMEKITEAVYGAYVEMLESPNDTTHEFRVHEKMDDFDQHKVAEAIKNNSLACNLYPIQAKNLFLQVEDVSL